MKLILAALLLSTSVFASLKNNPMRKMKSAEFMVAETIIDKNCDSSSKYAEVKGPMGNSYEYICKQNMVITLFEGSPSRMRFMESKSNEEIITITHPHEISRLKSKLKEAIGQKKQAEATAQKREEFKKATIKQWSK